MIKTTFDDLLDGECFILLDSDYFHREDSTYYVFEKTVPFANYDGRPHVMNAKRLPDECYCTLEGNLEVIRVGVRSCHLAMEYDFENAKKEEPKPRMEIDYGECEDMFQ